ncbi:MAG: hypothetical protein HWE27_07690 [Gammaproteobacteria bacterium]|nr:hypothetical protein [Gammaproteobacteria bacterium]
MKRTTSLTTCLINSSKKALPLAIIFASGSAFAIDNMTTVCSHMDKQRKIELVYPENTQTPCEVRYTKGEDTKVLWSASLEAGFCEMKYSDFVKKQEGWGWSCEEMGKEPAVETPEEEPQDEMPEEEVSEESSETTN